ncbi:MAG: SIS domain-containing protein [Actinomycetota bacterium]
MEQPADSLGCAKYLGDLASLLDRSCGTVAPVRLERPPTALYLVGTGALGGSLDAVAAWLSPRVRLPIVRLRGHDVVHFPSTALVLGVSFAGDTPETSSHLQRAAASGATVVLLAARGPMIDEVLQRGGRVIPLDTSAPGPRWAYLQTVLSALWACSGLVEPIEAASLDLQISNGIDRLRTRYQGDDHDVAKIARQIDRTMILTLGSGALGAVAAERLAAQIEENAKTLAFSLSYPGIAYSTVAGFGQCGDLTRQVFTALEVVVATEAPEDAIRRSMFAEMLDELVANRITLHATGTGELDQFMDLVGLGDRISLALATHVGIDPGPVPAIVEMKQAVARG